MTIIPIRDPVVIQQTINDVEQILKSKLKHEIDFIELAEHIPVNVMLSRLTQNKHAEEKIRDAICGKDVTDIYKYIDLPHKSGKPTSAIFPQDLIDELDNTESKEEINTQRKTKDLTQKLQQAQYNNITLQYKMHEQELVHQKQTEYLNSKIQELKDIQQQQEQKYRTEWQQITQQTADIFTQQIQDYKQQIEELTTRNKILTENNTHNFLNISEKINIAFIAIIAILIINNLFNLIRDNRNKRKRDNEIRNQRYIRTY